MTVLDDMNQRIKEARSEGTVSGRFLAILIEQAMERMTKDQLQSDIEDCE
jgi:hypothetical protein